MISQRKIENDYLQILQYYLQNWVILKIICWYLIVSLESSIDRETVKKFSIFRFPGNFRLWLYVFLFFGKFASFQMWIIASFFNLQRVQGLLNYCFLRLVIIEMIILWDVFGFFLILLTIFILPCFISAKLHFFSEQHDWAS